MSDTCRTSPSWTQWVTKAFVKFNTSLDHFYADEVTELKQCEAYLVRSVAVGTADLPANHWQQWPAVMSESLFLDPFGLFLSFPFLHLSLSKFNSSSVSNLLPWANGDSLTWLPLPAYSDKCLPKLKWTPIFHFPSIFYQTGQKLSSMPRPPASHSTSKTFGRLYLTVICFPPANIVNANARRNKPCQCESDVNEICRSVAYALLIKPYGFRGEISD